ncbi:MAG TPA: Fe-S cluster assembly protein SufD [Gammaproteobacteria bacterium]|nr:Fe-S cluster assembly protein SufD [Gammaproteobacteria bacterium]
MKVVAGENMINATDFSAIFQKAQPQLIGQNLPKLQALRKAALAEFLQQGFPSRKEENWKYTDLTFLAKQPLVLASGNTDKMTVPIDFPAHQLVFVDGHFSQTLSSIHDLEAGVLLLPLGVALTKHAEKLQAFLQQLVATTPLVNFNTAFFSDGVCLWVPPNTVVKKPIHCVFLTSTQQEVCLCSPRNILVLEENSKAVIVEQHLSESASHHIYYKNLVTQIEVRKNADLSLYKIQQENPATIHTAMTVINQHADSRVRSCSISLGAKLARDDLNFSLNAPGAYCQLRGLYIASGQQHVDHHTRIDHRSTHGTSDEYYKGILSDQAKGVFNGKVIVHPFAQHTQSQQTNKNILLTQTAEMNTKPELEIYADDVQCTHGATVGQIDDEALFYLRSRGLDAATATSLLTEAFAKDVLSQINEPEIAEYLQRLVLKKLS